MLQRSPTLALVALTLLLPVLGCEAQVPNQELQIAGAVRAAPADLRAAATVYGYDAEGTLVTLRDGSNDLVCLADQPGNDQFHTACYHAALEPYMARGRALRLEGINGQESFIVRHEEAEAGTLAMPDEPAMVYNLSGDSFDPETGEVANARVLYAVYIPYATTATTGLPSAPAGPGVPWLMRAGTPSAHIMIIPD